jgi:DNA-nicking Smr family endonuclease
VSRRSRDLSDEEQTLWQGVARSIKPLRRPPPKKADAASPHAVKPIAKPAAKPAPARVVARPAPSPPPPPTKPLAPLDRRTRQKLARGRESIDAKLDLHGMTQAEAHGALSRFLHRAHGDDLKFVLVVTGKGVRGQGESRGVLRRQVPQWLALPEFRDLVLSFEAAHVGHGGEGALYVRLRKRR